MLKTLRKQIVAIVAGLSLALVPAMLPAAVYAADDANIQSNLECGTTLVVEAENADCSGDINTGTQTISTTIKRVVNIFSAIIGIVAVIMIIWGGFKYISSGGDSGNVTSAKNTIIYAVIGLIIVAMAQFIVQFVLGRIVPQA